MTEATRWVIRPEGGGNLSIHKSDSGHVYHRNYYARKERLALPFGHELPALLDDLVDLALTVYAADRFVQRRQLKEENRSWWQRRFEIQFPVSDLDRWNRLGVSRLLSEALGFLTEDVWEFSFFPRERRVRRSLIVQRILFPPEPPVAAALFSGGLDSLAGLAIQLAEGGFQTASILTCATNSRLLKIQRKLLESFHSRTKVRLLPVILPIRLCQDRRAYNMNERSQRGRGFLFAVLGSVAAMMAGSHELLVLENGIGSINLPVSEAQIGVQSSRATHPLALRKLGQFLCSLLDLDFRIRLPFLFSTKGAMCARLRESPFADLAMQSMSCDGFPPRLVGPEQCGVCTSCLLRRQALWSSGFAEDRQSGKYRYDVLKGLETIPVAKLAPLWDMVTQVEKLGRAVGTRTPWEDLTVEYPELLEVREVLTEDSEPIAKADIERQLLALYRNYWMEWQPFPAQPAGWTFGVPDLRLSA